MRAKEFLSQYLWAAELVRQCEHDIYEIEATIDTISYDTDGMPRGSEITDRTARIAVSLADAKRKRELLIIKAWEIRERVEAVIQRVEDPVQSRLLYMRYILDADWQTVADDKIVSCTVNHARGKLHSNSLKSVEIIIGTDDLRPLQNF